MAVTLTIGGVSKQYRVGSLRMSSTANGRTTCAFSVRSNDGTYRPALDAEVIVEHNATRIFGGLIDKPSEASIIGDKWGAYAGITTRISAVDFNHYVERRFVNETLAAGTLKSMLQTLVANYLTGYGVTLHASQVDGPTLPAIEYKYRLLGEVLNELSKISGKYGDPYVWRIDFSKVLRMYQPSTTAAPFNITAGDKKLIGDVTVEQTRDKYANRVIVKVPSKMEIEHVETFTGDGSTSAFTPADGWSVLKTYGYVTYAGNYETLGPAGDPDGPTWEYDSTTNTLTRMDGAPANAESITFKFDGEFSGEGIASDSAEITAHGIWEKVVVVESVPTDTTAQALAEGYLADALEIPKTIRYKTFETGIEPGQTQTVTLAGRNLSAVTGIITDVDTNDYDPHGIRLERSVTLSSGATAQDGWRDIYKLWSGDKTGGAAVVPVASTPSVDTGSLGPGGPDKSNQFNDAGVFGGHANWTFDKTTTTVMVGTGHTPGGADNLMNGRGHTIN